MFAYVLAADKLVTNFWQGYRSLSTDTTYTHMIDEIQSNVENLQGKTIRQILHEIK